MIAIKRSITIRADVERRVKATAGSEGQVRCDVTWNKQRVRLAVGFRVTLTGWSAEMQRCIPKSTHGKQKTPAAVINRAIDDFIVNVDSIFMEYEQSDTVPTAQEFRQAYNKKFGKNDGGASNSEAEEATDSSIFPIYDKFVADGESIGRWRAGTLKKIRIVRKHLFEISPTLTFEDIEKDGMSLIISYLSKLPDKDKKKGLSNPTINKEIAVVKSFVRWAVERGYTEHNRFIIQKAHLKSAQKTVIFLDWDELMRVYNHDFKNKNYLAQVRDVFCFCCFTSLRYSDARNLKRSDIGESSFTITTIKTDDTLTIDLNKYSRAILAKYADADIPGDRALPVISNQRMNEYIKLVGKECKIDTPVSITIYKGTKRIDKTSPKWELLSTHAGRRTFISNALMLGIPPNIVMKWTGHSDYKAMKPYIDIVDKAKRAAMTAFDYADDSTHVGQRRTNVGQNNED